MTDLDGTEHIESIADAIGTATLAQLMVEKRRVRALALDGTAPTDDNAHSGRYDALRWRPQEPAVVADPFPAPY